MTPAHDQRLRDVFPVLALAVVGVIVGVSQVMGVTAPAGDAVTYWQSRPGAYDVGVYVYSPVLTQLIEPLRWIDASRPFVIAWSTICFGSLGYIFGRWAFLVLILFVPATEFGHFGDWWYDPISIVLIGNITVPMVAAMIAGMRHPGWWAVPLLTKITPGVGLLWFAFRREWRSFATGIGVTAAIVLVFYLIDPGAWVAYVKFALANSGSPTDGPPIVGPPLLVRLPIAVLLVAVAARLNQPRLVPVACAVGIIGLYGAGTFITVAMGALSPRLARARVEAPTRGRGPERLVAATTASPAGEAPPAPS